MSVGLWLLDIAVVGVCLLLVSIWAARSYARRATKRDEQESRRRPYQDSWAQRTALDLGPWPRPGQCDCEDSEPDVKEVA